MRKWFMIAIQAILLYGIYWVGTFLEQVLHLPIPGSVIGMILLFILLVTNRIKPVWIQEGSTFFISHLTLFFIPATVGIINYLELFAGKGFLLVLITIGSTLLVMVSSSAFSQWLIRKGEEG